MLRSAALRACQSIAEEQRNFVGEAQVPENFRLGNSRCLAGTGDLVVNLIWNVRHRQSSIVVYALLELLRDFDLSGTAVAVLRYVTWMLSRDTGAWT